MLNHDEQGLDQEDNEHENPYPLEKYLKSLDDAQKEYKLSILTLGQFQTFIGGYLLSSFTFPSIPNQGKDREKDINIAIGIMSAIQVLSVLAEIVIAKARISPSKRQELKRGLRHLRTGSIEVGIFLLFIRELSGLLEQIPEQDQGQFVKDIIKSTTWLFDQSILARGIIALATTTSFSSLSYYLNRKDQGSHLQQEQRDALHQRKFNGFVLTRWLVTMPVSAINQFVFSTLVLDIINGFADEPLKPSLQLKIASGLASAALLANLLPDHPAVKLNHLRRFVFRAGDKFYKYGMRFLVISFMAEANIISFKAKKLEDLVINNNTTIGLLYLNTYLAMHLSEVLYRLTSAMNDDPQHYGRFLKVWDIAREEMKLKNWVITNWQYPWLVIAYGIAVLPIIGISALRYRSSEDINSVFSLLKKISSIVNDSFFYGSLLLQSNILGSNTAVRITVIGLFLIVKAITEIFKNDYQAVRYINNSLKALLLSNASIDSLNIILKPLDATIPSWSRFPTMGAALVIAMLGTKGDYTRTGKLIADGTSFAISTATLYNATSFLNHEEETGTGLPMLLFLLTVNVFIMMTMLFKHTIPKKPTQNSSQPKPQSKVSYLLEKCGLLGRRNQRSGSEGDLLLINDDSVEPISDYHSIP